METALTLIPNILSTLVLSKNQDVLDHSNKSSGITNDSVPIPKINSVLCDNDTFTRIYSLRDDLQFRSALLDIDTDINTFATITDTVKYDPSRLRLCEDGIRSVTIDNAGGKSVVSEMMSIHYFSRVFGSSATLLEMEIEYWAKYKMVDFITTVDNNRIGVSVTRAMGFPSPDDFENIDAERLINKKLFGLIVARNAVQKKHRFFRSVLHVWCQTERIASLINKAYNNIQNKDYGMDIRGNVAVILTVCPEKSLYNDKCDNYCFD